MSPACLRPGSAMTRFARAKGSKASNERVAEEATSWAEMKEQLHAKKLEADNKKNQMEADAKRKQNYDNFIKETEAEESKNSVWADFPDTTITTNKKSNNKPLSENDKSVEKLNIVKRSAHEIDANGNAKNNEDASVTPKTHGKKRKLSAKGNGNKNGASSKKEKIGIKASNVSNVVAKPKKAVEEMTQEERKKIGKKKEKMVRQLEKKKMKKQQLKTEAVQSGQSTQNHKTPSKVKKFDANKEHKRRKPVDEKIRKVAVNGKEIELVYFDGFPIKREDAERLTTLRKQMISKGLPRSEVNKAMKLERRRAEKALARDKKNVCYNCRQAGHVLSECPAISAAAEANVDTAASGICFKCGSTEHTQFACKVVKGQEFRFASCFICKEQGHISWQCPDNAKGLYPKGGACKLCGDVTHLKKNCPRHLAAQQALAVHVHTFDEGASPDSLGLQAAKTTPTALKPNRIIKF